MMGNGRSGVEKMKAWMFLFSVLAVLPGHADSDAEGFVRLTPDELVWQDLEGGVSVAVIEGDPQKAGFYIIRVRFSPGVFSRPHYHPHDRFVTVIRGTWWTGTGPAWNKDNTIPLGPGGYMKHPAGAVHYDGAKAEETIVEIKGMGPAPIIYVDGNGKPVGGSD